MIAGSRQLQAHKDRRVKGGHIIYYFMLHIIDSPGRLQLDGEGGGECVTYNIRLRGFVCVCVWGGGRWGSTPWPCRRCRPRERSGCSGGTVSGVRLRGACAAERFVHSVAACGKIIRRSGWWLCRVFKAARRAQRRSGMRQWRGGQRTGGKRMDVAPAEADARVADRRNR